MGCQLKTQKDTVKRLKGKGMHITYTNSCQIDTFFLYSYNLR